MKKTKKSLRRITATLVAMAASASFAAAPISGAGVTFNLPSFNASASDAETLTYKDFSYKVTDDGIVITAYSGTEAKPVIPSAIDETAVISISNSAFEGCTSITEIEIPSSVTSIGVKAFKDCTKLKKLTLNEGLTTIGEACFANTKISSVNIPSTLVDVYMTTNYYTGPFSGCDLLKDVAFSEKSTIIAEYLFKNCGGLETITIPDTITTIEKSAFNSCANLAEVEISSSVTSIGNSAFESCVNLTEIEIPSSVTQINPNAFKGCTKLEKLTLNEGLTTIGEACFANTKISSVNIPSTLVDVYMTTNYYTGPFSGCDLLKDVAFSEKSTIIAEYLFKNCGGLETITIPDTITTIEKSAFNSCANLAEVEISSSVTSIGNSAFESCVNLKEIEIPSSVTQINPNAFKGCTKLEKVTLNEGLTTIGEACFANTKINSVNIPSTLVDVYMTTNYNTGPFSGCNLLKDVTIDEKVTTIPNYLFRNCSGLETIDIPYFVRSIGKSAFENCSSLKKITIHNPYCEINDTNIAILDGSKLYGYKDSTAEYYAEDYRREFGKLGSFTLGDVNGDGAIDASDASMVLSEYALLQTGNESTFTEIQQISADVNKNYSIASSDASKILEYYADSATGKKPTWD